MFVSTTRLCRPKLLVDLTLSDLAVYLYVCVHNPAL